MPVAVVSFAARSCDQALNIEDSQRVCFVMLQIQLERYSRTTEMLFSWRAIAEVKLVTETSFSLVAAHEAHWRCFEVPSIPTGTEKHLSVLLIVLAPKFVSYFFMNLPSIAESKQGLPILASFHFGKRAGARLTVAKRPTVTQPVPTPSQLYPPPPSLTGFVHMVESSLGSPPGRKERKPEPPRQATHQLQEISCPVVSESRRYDAWH